jgi:lipoyl(octanoyl) transferase
MLRRAGCSRLVRASRFLTTGATATTNTLRKCVAYRLGVVDYETAWGWQKELIRQRIAAAREGRPIDHDVVLLLQHPSVYTLGRGATMDNVKFDPAVDALKLIRVDRGGEVTYHGLGQLVVYPILDLAHHKKDLHWYLRQVEEVVIRTLGHFDIKGERVEGLTGVWVEEPSSRSSQGDGERDMRKITAVGTHASKWITMHGFAVNVTTDLTAFDRIIPCGIDDRAVTSVERYRPDVSLKMVEDAAIKSLAEIFHLEIADMTADTPLPSEC